MVRTQIIKENDKPIAVILDYQEYLRMKAHAEDKSDYISAALTKRSTKKWTFHEAIKKSL